MLSELEQLTARERARVMLEEAGCALREDEETSVEVFDFGKNDASRWGLQRVTYVNTAAVCARDLVLFQRQVCPEHRNAQRERTLRCRWGDAFLYVPGTPTTVLSATVRLDPQQFSVFHEIHLEPGDQVTIPPGAPHWFQAGDEGVILSEFATPAPEGGDVYTDPAVVSGVATRTSQA